MMTITLEIRAAAGGDDAKGLVNMFEALYRKIASKERL